MLEFCQRNYEFDNLDEIEKFDIKKTSKNKISKQNLQILAFVYTCLIHFPVNDFSIQTFTSAYFFEDIFHIITVKIHLHPQHPCDRLKQKTNKLEFNVETFTEIPFIDTDPSFDTKESIARENKIIDQLIRNLSPENDRYYIEYEEGSDIFRIHRKKNRILNRKKKMICSD